MANTQQLFVNPEMIRALAQQIRQISGQIKQNMSSSWTSGWFSAMWIYFV